jgi:hypothetical protein
LICSWARGPIEQRDEAGVPLSKPVLHFNLPLADMDAARTFLREHGARIACYKLDPREQGTLMIGFIDDGDAKTFAREELGID